METDELIRLFFQMRDHHLVDFSDGQRKNYFTAELVDDDRRYISRDNRLIHTIHPLIGEANDELAEQIELVNFAYQKRQGLNGMLNLVVYKQRIVFRFLNPVHQSCGYFFLWSGEDVGKAKFHPLRELKSR